MSDTPSNFDMSIPQRQHPMGVVVYMLHNFRAMITLFIAFFAITSSSAWFWSIVAFVSLPVLIIFGVFSYYQYRNFTFQVADEELIIHKGIFFTERIVIDVDRIQSIHITENIVQRLLGLVALKVDTAGSKGNELEIPALERKKANALKMLLRFKKQESSGEINPELAEIATAQDTDELRPPKKVLVQLGIKDLIVVGLTENHLRTGILALAFVFGTISQYQQMLESYIQESVDVYAQQALRAGIKVILIGIVLFTIISICLSIFRAVLRFYDLKAVLHSDAVEISTGLVKRNSYRLPIRKIQYVKWVSNPLRRWAGFESAVLKPSSSVGETNKTQRIEIPALHIHQSEALANGIFPDYQIPAHTLTTNADAYARFAGIVAGILLFPIISVLVYLYGYWPLLTLLAIPLIAFLGYRYGRSVKLDFDSEYLCVRKGEVFTHRDVMATYKIQALSIHQNIGLAHRKLCHLRIFTAAGELSVRYLTLEDSQKLYDFLLLRVEKGNEPWM